MRSLHPGNINEQFVKGRRDGKVVTRGPYPVLCWRVGKRVYSLRLRSEQEIQEAQHDTENFRRFKELCKELEDLTLELGKLERDQHSQLETVKKTRKSPSSKAKRSRT
jgi:hypothetical protein